MQKASQVPAFGRAGSAQVGNGMVAPMSHPMNRMQCSFPQPPPKRCYCHPAAFTSLDGRGHHRLLDAYGNSTPCSGLMY